MHKSEEDLVDLASELGMFDISFIKHAHLSVYTTKLVCDDCGWSISYALDMNSADVYNKPFETLAYNIFVEYFYEVVRTHNCKEVCFSPPWLEFRKELMSLINKHSLENYSNTPDHVLADMMFSTFMSLNTAIINRDLYYGHFPKPGQPLPQA